MVFRWLRFSRSLFEIFKKAHLGSSVSEMYKYPLKKDKYVPSHYRKSSTYISLHVVGRCRYFVGFHDVYRFPSPGKASSCRTQQYSIKVAPQCSLAVSHTEIVHARCMQLLFSISFTQQQTTLAASIMALYILLCSISHRPLL
jgi:hypothetical protein